MTLSHSGMSDLIARRYIRPVLALLLCSALFGASAEPYDEVWEFSQTTDPFHGGSIAIATIQSERVQALVRCWTKTGELDVSFLLAPGAGRADSENVLLGFDQRLDDHRIWRVSSNGLALVVPREQRNKLIKRMRVAANMRISLDTTNESASLLQVPLAGSSRAIGSVLQVCS